MCEGIRVSLDGRGDFKTISEALFAVESLPAGPVRILVYPGTYREKLMLTRAGLRLEGAGAGDVADDRARSEAAAGEVRVEWDDHATRLLPDGMPMGTFNSYVVYVGAPDIVLSGLTIENTAGDGRIVGQAVALYADADRLLVDECHLLARQDTLCTGPLPRDPVPKGVNLLHRVAGLGEDEPALPFRQIYRNCLISGDVDFIFGSAAALFENCEIRSVARGGEDSFIAAPSTWPGQKTGFLFQGCTLSFQAEACDSAAAGDSAPVFANAAAAPVSAEAAGDSAPVFAPNSGSTIGQDAALPLRDAALPLRDAVYLGRPWRPCGKACFVDCVIGGHIAREGWHDWDKPEARTLSYFGERGSTGPGAPDEGYPAAANGTDRPILASAVPHSAMPGSAMPGRVAWAKRPEKALTDAMYAEISSFLPPSES